MIPVWGLFALAAATGGGLSVQVESFELANGLSVHVLPDPTLPRVYVEVAYRVGSGHEEPGRTGLAHLFEHLMFEGSRNVPEGAFDTWLEAAGGENNAWTSADQTTYYETVPPGALDLALFLEADRMRTLLEVLDDARVDGQREVVRNELRQTVEETPYGRVDQVLPSALFPQGHPYSWSVIGSHEDLAAVSAEAVRDFFRRYYRPSNASLMIAGAVDPAEVRAKVERAFGPIPSGAAPRGPRGGPVGLTKEQRLVLEDKVELPKLVLAWPTPAAYQPGDAPLDILADVLTEGRRGWLRRRLVDELGIAQSVSAWQYSRRLSGQFELHVLARPGVTLERLLTEVDRVLDELRQRGPGEDEVQAAVRSWEVSFLDQREQLSRRANQAHRYFLATGNPDWFDEDLARYTSLTASDIRTAARTSLAVPRVVMSVVPRGKLELAVPGSRRVPDTTPPPRSEARPAGPLPEPELSPPAPGSPAPWTLPTVERFRLANGLEVVLVRRAGTGLLDAQLVAAHGAEVDPSGQEGRAHFVARWLRRGAGGRDALQFDDELRRAGARLGTWASWRGVHLHLHAPMSQASSALALLADVVRQPTFADDELALLRREESTELLEVRDDPGPLASLAQQRARFGGEHREGRRLEGTSTSQAALTAEQLRSTWAREGAAGATLFVAADTTRRELEALLGSTLARWKRGQAPRVRKAPPNRGPAEPTGAFLVDRPGAEQSVIAVFGPLQPLPRPYEPALAVMNTLLGGSFSSRLNQNLREKNQYAYGAGSAVVRVPGRAALRARAQVATPVTGPAVAEVQGELDRIGSPPPGDELARATAYAVLTLPEELETGGSVVGQLAFLHLWGGGLEDLERFAQAAPGLSAAEVAQAGRRWAGAGPADRLVVVVGDAAKVTGPLRETGLAVEALVVDELLGPLPATGP